MTAVSALVVIHDEEARLAACLEKLRFADEIVVVLDRCTDRSKEIEGIFLGGTGNSLVADLKIKDPTNFASPDFTLESGSPLASGGAAPSDNFFDAVTYIGGFDASNDWTAGWTHHDAD